MEASLVTSGAGANSELLPPHTQVFAAAITYTAAFHCCSALSMVSLLTLIVAGGVEMKDDVDVGTPLLAAAFSISLLFGLAAFFVKRRDERLYDDALRRGEHREGIILFETGDLAIRLQPGCAMPVVDKTIEASFLSRAEVDRKCTFYVSVARPKSFLRPFRSRNFLRLYYLRFDAKPAVFSISEEDLRDSVLGIADAINDCKGRSAAGSFSLGAMVTGFGGA